MNDDQLRELLRNKGNTAFDEASARAMLRAYSKKPQDVENDRDQLASESVTPEQIPQEKQSIPNDALDSEFMLPGNDQSLMEDFGYNQQQRQVEQEQQRQAEQEQQRQSEILQQKQFDERPPLTKLNDFPAGVNSELFSLLGIPADAWNATAKMLDAEDGMGRAWPTGDDMKNIGADLGVNYPTDKTPDSAFTKAGQYLTQGVAFLLPVLSFGKAAGAGKVTGETLGGWGAKPTGVPKLVAQTVAKPFQQSAGKAWAAEATASTVSGIAAHQGGEAFGPTGEMVGGVLGGGIAQLGTAASGAAKNVLLKQFSGIAEAGSKVRLQDYMGTVTPKENIPQTINKSIAETLPQAKLSAAKLSEDVHLMTLEKEVGDANPQVFNNLKNMQDETNALIKQEMEKLGGSVKAEQTQAYLKGRVDKLEYILGERLKISADRAKSSLEPLSSSQELDQINTLVRKQIEAAKKQYIKAEKVKWDKVSATTKTSTENVHRAYQEILSEQALYKSSDKKDIPSFIKEMLGFEKKGKDGVKTFVRGKYGDSEGVLDLKKFRTKIYGAIENSESPEQQRILKQLRDAAFEDMKQAQGSGVQEAIAATKLRHDTFEGSIMNKIFARDKFGKELDDTLTLKSIPGTTPGGGLQSAEMIEKIITAAPEAKGSIENLLKVQIANSNILQKGKDNIVRINVKNAQKYLESHKSVLKKFPELKKQLDFAIGQEQRFVGTKGSVESRLKRIQASTASKLSKDNVLPGQVLPDIMNSADPYQEMRKVLQQSNKTGRRGIRNSVVADLYDRSLTATTTAGEEAIPFVSGKKLAENWHKNKKIYSQAFNPYELKRFERILATAVKNEGLTGKGTKIGLILPPQSFLVKTMLGAAGLSLGHKVGKVTGSPLAATARVMGYTDRAINFIDAGKAKKMLIDAIENPDLFKAITVPTENMTAKQQQYLKSWMAAATVDAYEPDDEIKGK